jgi:hypothetical protein
MILQPKDDETIMVTLSDGGQDVAIPISHELLDDTSTLGAYIQGAYLEARDGTP